MLKKFFPCPERVEILSGNVFIEWNGSFGVYFKKNLNPPEGFCITFRIPEENSKLVSCSVKIVNKPDHLKTFKNAASGYDWKR